MIARWQESWLRELLAVRKGVHLTGVRQCGKTTLAGVVSGPQVRHFMLDDETFLKAAKDDPKTFIDRVPNETLVIDEIQKAPELLNAIKMRVDHDNSPGQYLITGSSNLHFVRQVTDSLAGRLGRIRLRTLALGELLNGKGDFLEHVFSREIPSSFEKFDKRDVIHQACCGGYPEPMGYTEKIRRNWFREYLNDLLTRDIMDVTEIRKLESLRKTADWLLAYSSKFFEQKNLCAASGLSKDSTANYVAALKALYVFDELPAWSNGDYTKLGKRAKYFAADPGLLANLLGWNEEQIYFEDDACGKLVETWVYHELASLVDLNPDFKLSQYRDSDKHEIDFIVENAKGEIVGIEVKSGAVSSDDFKHLKWFARTLASGRFTGIVLYSGTATLSFGEGLYAVPLRALGM